MTELEATYERILECHLNQRKPRPKLKPWRETRHERIICEMYEIFQSWTTVAEAVRLLCLTHMPVRKRIKSMPVGMLDSRIRAGRYCGTPCREWRVKP